MHGRRSAVRLVRGPSRAAPRAAHRSALLSGSCTCGVAPLFACITCARWHQHYRMVKARRQSYAKANLT